MKIKELLNDGIIDWAARAGAKALAPAAKSVLRTATKDPAVRQAAKQAVQKVAPNAAKTAAKVGQAAAAMTPLVKAGGRILTILKFFGLAKMTYDYYDDIKYGEEMVEKGEWTPAQFMDYRQGKMTVLVSQIAASTVLFGALKITSGWAFLVKGCQWSRLKPVVSFGNFLSGIDRTVQVAMIGALSTQKAREAIAELIGQGWIDSMIGGTGVELIDKVKHALGIDDATSKIGAQAEKDKESDPESKQDVDATSSKPSPVATPSTKGPEAEPTMTRKSDGGLDIQLDPTFMDKPKK